MAARRRQPLPALWLAPLGAWLAGLIAALHVVAGPAALGSPDALGSTAALAVLVAGVLCAMALAAPLPGQLARAPIEPALDRLRGSFQAHSRPGVPGRVRARAPGR